MEGTAKPDLLEQRVPLTLVVVGVGLIGGLAGGVVVGIIYGIWSTVASGMGAAVVPGVALGSVAGLVVGTVLGLAASLLRLLALALRTGLVGELVAVSLGAIATPFILFALLGGSWGWWSAPMGIIAALAALQFCRTVLKRVRQNAPEFGAY